MVRGKRFPSGGGEKTRGKEMRKRGTHREKSRMRISCTVRSIQDCSALSCVKTLRGHKEKKWKIETGSAELGIPYEKH